MEARQNDLLGLEVESTPDESEFLTLDFSPNKETVHRWRKLPDCDEFVGARRSKHTSVAYKGAIYVFGGDNGKQMLNDMIRFDLNDLSWGRAFTMGSLPDPRYHHTAVVHSSSMYVFGGYTGDIHNNSNLHNRNDLYEYKFSTGQWSQVRVDEPLPPARSAHSAAVADDCLWIFGGFDGHKRLNDMWRISLSGPLRNWERVTQDGQVPPICCNFSSTVHDDSWFIFSGQTGAKGSNHLYQFSFRSQRWTRISTDHILRAAAHPPARRYGHSMVAHNKLLYVFGGAAESVHEPTLHVYDLHSHLWTDFTLSELGQRPSGRLFHSAVTISDAMYIFGGMTDKDGDRRRSSEIYRFQFSSYPRCSLHDDFGRMLESRQFCDLRFLVGKDRVPIYAHIAIVAARSLYLRTLIKASREASGGVEPVPAPQHSPAFSPKQPEFCVLEPFAFEMILAYIYTDKIDPTQRGQEPRSNGVVLLIMEVYRLALAFSMKRLECLAIRYLESMIGLGNVLVALSSASRLGLTSIKEFCFRLVVKEAYFHQIVMSKVAPSLQSRWECGRLKEFETLEQPLMVELIRRRQNFRTSGQPEVVLGTEVEGKSLEEDLRAFLDDGDGADFCDITLVANDVSIPAHKIILSSRSAYFETMFRNWAPTSNTVEMQLGEVVPSGKAFRSLLRYIYFGAVDMPPEDSLFLFAAPPFYGFANNRLQVFCKENLETNIGTENVVEILGAAHKIQANEMKRHSLSKIVNNLASVAKHQKEKLSRLDKNLLLDIILAVAEGSGKDSLDPEPSPHLPSTLSFSSDSN